MLFAVPLMSKGQPRIAPKDSMEIKSQIEGFYAWYIDLSNNKRLKVEFNPTFVKSNDGMTTLDFKNYKASLRKYNFSDDFIQTRINDYQPCVDHLANIPFDKFAAYKDLDDFEAIQCDFSNYYEWTGGMEPMNKAELSSLMFINKRKIFGRVSFSPHGGAQVTFKKISDDWEVDNLILE